MIIFGEGKSSLPEIANELLSKEEIDGAVIKHFLQDAEVDYLEEENRRFEDGVVVSALKTIVPQLRVVRSIVKEYWERVGYSGYALSDELFFTDFIPAGRGIAPHIDYYDNIDNFVQAGLSYSISAGKPGTTASIRTVRPTGREFTTNQRTVNIGALLEWQAAVNSQALNWQKTVVGRGDVFILPQHISPAGHAVIAEPGRTAFIIDHLAYGPASNQSVDT